MKNRKQLMENAIHGIFLILGLIAVGCVLLITVYLVLSGIPAIRKIGILKFLFGKKWASTAAQPQYGLVGMLFFCQFFGMRTSLLAGAFTLVIMNLPTVMRTTQESLKTVLASYREGAFGLGAGKWRVIYTVVLPGCVDGVITGCSGAHSRRIGGTSLYSRLCPCTEWDF